MDIFYMHLDLVLTIGGMTAKFALVWLLSGMHSLHVALDLVLARCSIRTQGACKWFFTHVDGAHMSPHPVLLVTVVLAILALALDIKVIHLDVGSTGAEFKVRIGA